MEPVHHQIIASLAFIVGLCTCILFLAPRIEADIQSRVEDSLVQDSWANIEVKGRSVYINGAAPAGARAYVKRRLRGVSGVGRILFSIEEEGE